MNVKKAVGGWWFVVGGRQPKQEDRHGNLRITPVAVQPLLVFAETAAGQVIVGFSQSLTVTWNVHCVVWPAVSVAVQVTNVVPLGKVEPDGGVHTVVTPEQLSFAVVV